MHFLADGFAFFAVGAHEFVVELEVHPQAGRAWFFKTGGDSAILQRWAGLNFGKGGFRGCLGGLMVVVRLEIEPHISGSAEVAFEAVGREQVAEIRKV